MDRIRWIFALVVILAPAMALADWTEIFSSQVVPGAGQSVIRHDWTSSATDSTPYDVRACTGDVSLRFDASTGDASTDATFQARMCKLSTDTAPYCRAITWPGPSDGTTWVPINAPTQGENFILVDALTATAGGDTARVDARCTGAQSIRADSGGTLLQTSPATNQDADRGMAQITSPAVVKYGWGHTMEATPPAFTGTLYTDSGPEPTPAAAGELNNFFGWYYNKPGIDTLPVSNMFEHAFDFSMETAYRPGGSTLVEWNWDFFPPDIQSTLTGTSGSFVVGDVITFSGGGSAVVRVVGPPMTYRQNYGTSALGETVTNQTRTGAGTLGALTQVAAVNFRPFLFLYDTMAQTSSFEFQTAAGDSTVAISGGFLRHHNRIVPGTVAAGTTALATAAIAAGTCDTTNVNIAASGAVATDTVRWSFAADPGVNAGLLEHSVYAGTNVISFRVCNPTAGSLTPGARTANWLVDRWL